MPCFALSLQHPQHLLKSRPSFQHLGHPVLGHGNHAPSASNLSELDRGPLAENGPPDIRRVPQEFMDAHPAAQSGHSANLAALAPEEFFGRPFQAYDPQNTLRLGPHLLSHGLEIRGLERRFFPTTIADRL